MYLRGNALFIISKRSLTQDFTVFHNGRKRIDHAPGSCWIRRHVYYLFKQQIIETTKWTTLSEIQSAIGVCLVKLSVCLFILRMIASTHKVMRRTLISLVTILTLLMLGNVLVICFQCVPFEAVWNPAIQARCIPASDLSRSSKAFNSRLACP